MKKTLRVGIVGAGVIGGKRADAISKIPGNKIVAFADTDRVRAKQLAAQYSAEVCKNWQELVARKDIDVVVVSVPGVFTAPIAIAALNHKKHVLAEKPFGVNAKESEAIRAAAIKNKRLVKAGFNHRFHPALMKAKELFDQGAIGKLAFIRARYGHGGRKGMEKEWRMNPKLAGGGELLDQGAHVVDLMCWFAGGFETAYGVCNTKVWKAPVEDNAFAILKNKSVTGMFHVSTTQWGNIFSFEVYGTKGFLTVEGLGRWYGVQTLKFGKRKLKFGDVQLRVESFPDAVDFSWQKEWEHFTKAIRGKVALEGSALDGLRANQIIDAIYESSRSGKEVAL